MTRGLSMIFSADHDPAFWITSAFAMIFPARKRENGEPAKFCAGNGM
jgi:hypothetical protein